MYQSVSWSAQTVDGSVRPLSLPPLKIRGMKRHPAFDTKPVIYSTMGGTKLPHEPFAHWNTALAEVRSHCIELWQMSPKGMTIGNSCSIARPGKNSKAGSRLWNWLLCGVVLQEWNVMCRLEMDPWGRTTRSWKMESLLLKNWQRSKRSSYSGKQAL